MQLNVLSYKTCGVATIGGIRKKGAELYLQDPRSRSCKRVPAVDDVSMLGETPQHVPHALLEGVDLRLDQNLNHQVVRGILDQALACKERAINHIKLICNW